MADFTGWVMTSLVSSPDKGRKIKVGTVALASGAATVAHGMDSVDAVFLTENAATASGDGLSYAVDGADIDIDSSNASSTATVSYIIFGQKTGTS